MRRLAALFLLCALWALQPDRLETLAAPPEPVPETPTLITALTFSPWQPVLALSWSPDGSRLAVGAGQSVYLVATDDWIRQPVLHVPGLVTGLAFHPDGLILAASGWDGHIRTVGLVTGKVGLDLAAHKKGANSIVYDPAGDLLATGGNDGMARLWNAVDGSLMRELIGGTFGVPASVFTLNGMSLAIANGPVVRLRDVTSGRFTHTLRGEGSYYCLAIHPDGRLLAAGNSQGQVWLWAVEGEEVLHQLAIPGKSSVLVWEVAFSPDGRWLAAAGGSGRVAVWQVEFGELVADWQAHKLSAASLAFSLDGSWLASGGLDGDVKIWNAAFH